MTEPSQGPSQGSTPGSAPDPAADPARGTVPSRTGGASRGGSRGSERVSPLTFYRQVVAELRKVVWPSQQQLVTYFFVVLVFVIVLIAYVSLLDLGFGKAIFAVFGGKPSH